jgi:hypothetical protein
LGPTNQPNHHNKEEEGEDLHQEEDGLKELDDDPT